ncbi:putative F-box protein At3g17480 [Silene latifolia]|uniref:putative F-box protein At3g17480 n=1 Tax=Silene latifolia TaxID=37657 RepID=UPI003D77A13E
MKNRKKAKTLPNLKYVPPELLSQIFAALPVKTLVRFRSLCKSWRSIIDDPDFIILHHNLYKTNSASKKLLALKGLGKIGTAGCLLTRSKQLRLWNPSIRKSLAIPRCPLSSDSSRLVRYLFGFANCSQDYKIIAISFTIQDRARDIKPVQNMRVAVYTLNDQQWSVRDNHDLNMSCCYFTHRLLISYHQRRLTQALIFRGAAHWVGTDPHDPYGYKPTHLFSFDFDLEKFNYLEFSFGLEEEWVSRPVFYNERDIGRCLVFKKLLYIIDSGKAEVIGSKMRHYLDLEVYSESLVIRSQGFDIFPMNNNATPCTCYLINRKSDIIQY